MAQFQLNMEAIKQAFVFLSTAMRDLDHEQDAPIEQEDVPPVVELDQEVLSTLGEDAIPKRTVGPPVQRDIATRWTNILKNGLSDENRQNIIVAYPPAENCQNLGAPKLNEEVSSAISEAVIKRDARLADLQTQVGASLAAIGRVLSSMLEEEGGGDRGNIRLLSDAGRLLANLHHSESNSRRDLISLNLNRDLRHTINNATVDGWLFGDNLGDCVGAESRTPSNRYHPQRQSAQESRMAPTPFRPPRSDKRSH